MAKNKKRSTMALQLLLLAAVSIFSVFIGVADIPFQEFFALSAKQWEVFLISRIPRLISILITGASLSVAGLIMQTISQNRFLSPDTAGTSEWCRLGVLLAIFFLPGASSFLRVGFAFVVSLIGTFLFMGLLSRLRSANTILLPLVGMMLGNVVGAITTFFAYQYDLVQNMTSWLKGNFSLVIQGSYELLYLSIPFLVLGYVFANHFTIAGMGKHAALSLGLNHKRIMRIGLAIVAMISSITIVSVGNIPFLGLIIPNLVRIYRGDSIKHSLFDTAWLGAFFVLICDIIGRIVIFPYEISIGVIVGITGSFLFLFLLFRRNRHAS